MTTKRWADIKASKMTPKRKGRLDREVKDELLTMELRELREEAGKTQVALAELADMTQAEISRFERRDDHLVSMVRKYVESLGGELEVAAVFGNKRITLKGV